MTLSIILPALDEGAGIAGALAALAPRARSAEVIVVDGGSGDNTLAQAAPLADRVLRAARGRAAQMNAGAALARGDVLLFLHADCRLPADADRLIADGLRASGRQWGRFDVRLAGRSRLLGMIGALMNLRSRATGIATGDQALFVARETFARLGGYADLPLMEDIELCARLKALGRPLCVAAQVVASGRRWDAHGAWRTVLLMWRLRLAYRFGADPAKLARRYGYRTRTAVAVAVLAKAPLPGFAKTRLIPRLGAAGAAQLQARLLEHTLDTVRTAAPDAIELWCTPATAHPVFARAAARGVRLRLQGDGDLGARLHAAATQALAAHARVLLVGTDCPALTPAHLRAAADALDDGDACVIPAADGGYVLLALARGDPRLFAGIEWGSARVMAQTRARLAALGWRWRELPPLWDVDTPADCERLAVSGLLPGFAAPAPAAGSIPQNKQQDSAQPAN